MFRPLYGDLIDFYHLLSSHNHIFQLILLYLHVLEMFLTFFKRNIRYFKNDSENLENFNVQSTLFNASKNSVDTQYSN